MKFTDPPPSDYEGDPISTLGLIVLGMLALFALALPTLVVIGFGLWW